MLKEERQALILNKLHASGKVVVSQLAVELNVSEDTAEICWIWTRRGRSSGCSAALSRWSSR